MSNNPSAASLLLTNLKLFNDAATMLGNEMVEHLANAFNGHLDALAKTNPWTVKYEQGDINFWLCPKTWDQTPPNARTRKEAWASFELESVEPGNEVYFWITQLCDVSDDGEAGIIFSVNSRFINWDQWDAWCSNIPNDTVQQLKRLGFEYRDDEKDFFRPIKLDPLALAKAWDSSVQDLSNATATVAEALQDSLAVAEIFDPILKSMLYEKRK